MCDIIIKEVVVPSAAYHQVWQVREDVLRKPLGLSLRNEDLSGDANDIILAACNDDNIAGCVMLHRKENGVMKLRQMAVAEAGQKKGTGRALVTAAEKRAIAEGYTKMDMHARMVAKGFYEKLGYTANGEIFYEVGIPHVMMEKQLAK